MAVTWTISYNTFFIRSLKFESIWTSNQHRIRKLFWPRLFALALVALAFVTLPYFEFTLRCRLLAFWALFKYYFTFTITSATCYYSAGTLFTLALWYNSWSVIDHLVAKLLWREFAVNSKSVISPWHIWVYWM